MKNKVKFRVPGGTKKVGSFIKSKLEESGVDPAGGAVETFIDPETCDVTVVWTRRK